MSTINNATNITAGIAPFSTLDTFETHTEDFGKGGYRSVANESERLAITTERRKEGMLVKQIDTSIYWELVGGIDNSNWQKANMGSKQIITPTFVITSLLQLGNQPINIKIPKSGIIKSISANCTTIGSTDCEIAIEKTNSTNITTNTGWSNILSSNLIIKANKFIDDKSLVISDDTINLGDYLRLNVIKNGTTLKGLTVELVIEC